MDTLIVNANKCFNSIIHKHFLSRSKFKHIYIINGDKIINIYDSVMSYCENLETIDISGLTNVEYIDDKFIYKCINLTTITKNLKNLIRVGSYWMSKCHKLMSFDMSDLKSLQYVYDNWLSDCINIQYINTSGLDKLEYVGNKWLYNCANLEIFDVSGLKNDISIDTNLFLHNCPKLKYIYVGSHNMDLFYKYYFIDTTDPNFIPGLPINIPNTNIIIMDLTIPGRDSGDATGDADNIIVNTTNNVTDTGAPPSSGGGANLFLQIPFYVF